MSKSFKIQSIQDQREEMNDLEREAGVETVMTTKEYAEYSLENDPTFFNYILPDGEFAGDYGVGATDEQDNYVADFIDELSNY